MPEYATITLEGLLGIVCRSTGLVTSLFLCTTTGKTDSNVYSLYTKATLHLASADVILQGKSAILAAHAKDPELTCETSTSFQTSYLQGVYNGRQYSLSTLDIAHPLIYFSCLPVY